MTGNPDLLAKILEEVSSYLSRSNPQADHGVSNLRYGDRVPTPAKWVSVE